MQVMLNIALLTTQIMTSTVSTSDKTVRKRRNKNRLHHDCSKIKTQLDLVSAVLAVKVAKESIIGRSVEERNTLLKSRLSMIAW